MSLLFFLKTSGSAGVLVPPRFVGPDYFPVLDDPRRLRDVPYCAPCTPVCDVGLSLYSEWNDVNHHRGARTGADGNQNYNGEYDDGLFHGRACAPYSDGASTELLSTTSCGACATAVVDTDC